MSDVLDVVIRVVAVLGAFLTLPLILGQMEHKQMAHMQSRLGPMYAGKFHGWAQLIADGVKFIQKEAVTPDAADKKVFALAPVVAFVPYGIVLVAIPLGPILGSQVLVGADLPAALFFVQRSPLDRTTRTVFAPSALMLAKELVCCGYQVCAWLTPRITNSTPPAS